MMDLVLSITESVSQVSLYLCSDAMFVHRGKGEGGGLPQYPATPIHDITDGLKRGEKGEHTETQSLLQSPNNSIKSCCGAHKIEREKKTSYSFSWKRCLNAHFRCRSKKYETKENETQ